MAQENEKNLAMDMITQQQDGGAPAGLAFLEKVNGLYIQQEWEVLETFTLGCYQGANRYTVMDHSGKVTLFTVKEETSCCNRSCCGKDRPFTMNINDETGTKRQRMMIVKRDYACCGWAVCPCCIHHLYVHYVVDAQGNPISHHGHDTLIAEVSVPWCGGCLVPTLDYKDRNGTFLGSMTGPCCCVTDFCGADFTITNKDGTEIGKLDKIRAKSIKDAVMEIETEADKFKITFPLELDPTFKMAILASLFQIDFAFFEDDRSPRECRFCDWYCCGFPCACFPKCFVCCCLFATKEDREKAEKKKEKGAPQIEEMEH